MRAQDCRAGSARPPGCGVAVGVARREAERRGEFHAEAAAERAEDAAEARFLADAALQFGIGEQGAELAGGGDGLGDRSEKPGGAARQGEPCGIGRRARPAARGTRARRRNIVGAEAEQKCGVAAQAGPEQDGEGAAPGAEGAGSPAPGDGVAQRVDQGAEAAGDIHERNKNILAPGWARILLTTLRRAEPGDGEPCRPGQRRPPRSWDSTGPFPTHAAGGRAYQGTTGGDTLSAVLMTDLSDCFWYQSLPGLLSFVVSVDVTG